MTQPAPKTTRPLSPHLQVYKPQMTSVLSILHRITGIGLTAALPVLVWWLVALSEGAEPYKVVMDCLKSPLGKLFLMGWAWAFSYHLCAGIRHLLWDAGWGFELKQVYASAKVLLGATTLLTLFLWIAILGA